MEMRQKWLVLALISFVTLLGTVAPSLASMPNTKAAEQLVDQLGAKALKVIQGVEAKSLTDDAAKQQFRAMLRQSFDLPTIARFTLGRYWRVATPSERVEFTNLLQTVILNKYADRLLAASGQTYSITKSQALNTRDSAVFMNVVASGEPPVALVWRVRHDGKQGPKIIDLAVEGVSMSVTHRSDFANTIERNGGSVRSLLDNLAAKKQ